MPGAVEPTRSSLPAVPSEASKQASRDVELQSWRKSDGSIGTLTGNSSNGSARKSSLRGALSVGSRGSGTGRDSRTLPLLEDVSAEPRKSVGEVGIVECEEWGGGTGFSSSDDESDAEPGGDGDATPAKGVKVVEIASEWAGGEDDSFDFAEPDADMDNRRARGRNSRKRSLDTGEVTTADSIMPFEDPGRRENRQAMSKRHIICECLKSQSTRFVVISCLHVCGWALQWCCMLIYFFWHVDNRTRVTLLLPIQVLGSGMAVYMTFHDADVIHRLHQVRRDFGDAAHRCGLVSAFVFLGLLQGIAVKRAWRRQIYAAELTADWDDDDLHAATASSVSYGGAERALPLALFTGVPFLLVNTIAILTARWVWTWWERLVLWPANIITLFNVSCGIVEIDVAVSSYVMKRYHMDPTKRGKRAGYFQFLYPFAHVAFRGSEVFLRVTMISAWFVLLKVLFSEWVVVGLMTDYFIGFGLLKFHSPDKERFLSHAVIAGMLMVVDVTLFVDQPNFAYPAKQISKWLAVARAISMALLILMIWIFQIGQPASEQAHEDCIARDKSFENSCGLSSRSWLFQIDTLLWTLLWYCVLRFSPWNLHVGDDLHTAARSGKEVRVKKLLEPDDQGQVLDVDGTTQDQLQVTPAMLAASVGHHTVLAQLHSKGANMNFKSEVTGDTPLHFAAQYDQAETCEWLIEQGGADPFVANKQGWKPDQVVATKYKRKLASKDTAQVFADFMDRTGSSASRRSFTGTRTSISGPNDYANVPTQFCASVQLKGLFPDAADDDTPSPRALQSVSGLVFSRGAGLLARCVLAREADTEVVPLGALRKVGELGKGGFGKVIEVEVPAEGGRGMFRRQSATKRYALKLQLKQHSSRSAFSENTALRTVQHRFIVRLERAFNTPKHFALLLELCPTDLNRILCEEDAEGRCCGLGHQKAARWMAQVLLAVVYLQSHDIVYRDLKPENILISTEDDAKLTDFGLAKVVTSADRMTMCGTMGFFPPELLFGVEDDEETISSRRSSRRGSGLSTCSSLGPDLKSHLKLDTYSYGVTLQLALLGEDGGQKKEIRRKGYMMLPIHQTEQENQAMLLELRKKDKLSDEAFRLLLGDDDVNSLMSVEPKTDEGPQETYKGLLPFKPSKRAILGKVVNHPFFLRELKCQDTREHLMKGVRNRLSLQ